MLYSTPFISILAFAPSVIATVVFLVFLCMYLRGSKQQKPSDALAAQKKAARTAGFTALTLWIMLGAFNGLLYIAVRNM